MITKKNDTNAAYPIGVVARLTRIHPETIRIWERRYRMIEPARASRGRRLFSDEDVHKLSLLKTLVDDGNPIGVIANLSIEELESRVRSRVGDKVFTLPRGASETYRVLTIGEELRVINWAAEKVEIVAAFDDVTTAKSAAPLRSADLVIWSRPSIHRDTAQEVLALLQQLRARRAVIVYGFGSSRAIAELESIGIRCVQGPARPSTFTKIFDELLKGRSDPLQIVVPGPEAIPPRRFTSAQLARIAASTPEIACECPHHLADLVERLAAFESYSAECASRSPADAAVHALLHATTATARALLESGLQHLAEAEGIRVD